MFGTNKVKCQMWGVDLPPMEGGLDAPGHWNNLTQEIVDARSVNVFKNRLDRRWQDMGI